MNSRPFVLKVKRPQNGTFKEYWHGTKRIRATDTVEDKQAVGVYREYDLSGNRVMEIPFENGKANGNGWVVEQGKRVSKRLGYGVCFDTDGSTTKNEFYWRRIYSEEKEKSEQ